MRLLIITQYFHPENFRINDLAVWMAQRGHDVTVLTGIPNYPAGRFFSGYGVFRKRCETWNGVKVRRVPLVPRGKGGGLRLALNYLSFALTSCLVGTWQLGKDFDVIFVHEPSPITVGIPAIAMRWRSEAPILFWVLDLWPDSVAAGGGVRARWLLGLLAWLTRWVYRHCERVLVQSRAFIPRVQAMGVPEERIFYFPNWAEAIFQKREAEQPPVPLPPGFRVMYAGNIGAAQDFPAILEAAEYIKGRGDIHWIIVGDGREAQWVREQIGRRGLGDTVHLMGSFPPERMPDFFAFADVMLVSLRADPIFALTIPAKLQAYMACGRPVLAMLDGEGARIVAEAQAGIAVPAGHPAELADAVLRMAGMERSRLDRMGQRACEYNNNNFQRDALFRQLESWMLESSAQPLTPTYPR